MLTKSPILLRCLLALVVGLPQVALAQTNKATVKRAVVVSWDGAADWIMDRLLAEQKLPNVARLLKNGVRAEYAVPAFPSKTACGHAAIWTGAFGDINGITGNSVPVLPKTEHTVLETRSGFLATSIQAEPLFVTAAKAGKKVLILSATQSFPPETYAETLKAAGVPRERFLTFDGFESPITPDTIWNGSEFVSGSAPANLPAHTGETRTFTFKIGETPFTATIYDDPNDPTTGFDTLWIQQGSQATTLKPVAARPDTKQFSPRFTVTNNDPQRGLLSGFAYFRLFALDPKTGNLVGYQRQVNGLRGTSTVEERRAYLDAYGGFHAAPFRQYQDGKLGKTLWDGGDGEAEKRLLETIRLDYEFLKRGTRYAMTRYKPDLMFHYSPMVDSAGHTWMGVLDPDSPRYKAELAAKLMPYYEQVYQLADDWLGTVMDVAGNEAAICLVSDHGMAGVGKKVSPNAILQAANLLTRTADTHAEAGVGKSLDLTKTRLCAPPWGDYLLVVNGTEWKDGIVPASERDTVLQQATDALLSARDPETQQAIITRVFRPGEVVGIGIGGVSGGDLYLDFAPGYVPTSGPQVTPVVTEASPIGAGVHGFFPLRTKMQAIFYVGGSGVRRGVTIPGIRQIDIAPTLARLLGIPAPAQSVGHILGECLP